ncbi:MAG: class I SAM-dependent methyltransferase [Acidobacteriaceae bacterium]|nr:class I SAM-dependent methyltransferase [Acidobacteriaceae bacterium]
MEIRDILAIPGVYQFYQEVGGFFGARLKAISSYLPLAGSEKILDIGCGPGFIVKHLPRTVTYVGYEPNESYIRYATRKFGTFGRFESGYFDEAAVAKETPPDVIMLNGVLHHMTDEQVGELGQLALKALKPGGRLFTFDACYVHGQNIIAKWLIDGDRGRYVRDEDTYRALLLPHFRTLNVSIDHNISRVPYTFITMIGTKGHDDVSTATKP